MMYAIYSQRLEKFFLKYQGKGLYWEETDFGELEKARLYKSEDTAFNATKSLMMYEPVVVPVDLVADFDNVLPFKDVVREKCESFLPNVELIDAMSSKEVEALSDRKWKEYVRQRNYLRDNYEDYKG